MTASMDDIQFEEAARYRPVLTTVRCFRSARSCLAEINQGIIKWEIAEP